MTQFADPEILNAFYDLFFHQRISLRPNGPPSRAIGPLREAILEGVRTRSIS